MWTHKYFCSEEEGLSGTQAAQGAQCVGRQQALRFVALHHGEALEHELFYKQKLRSLKRAPAQKTVTTSLSALHARRQTPDVHKR